MLSPKLDKPADWQHALKNLVTDPDTLFEYLALDKRYLTQAKATAKHFPLRVPYPYLERIKRGDMRDPLLRQILPLGAEQATVSSFNTNPLSENLFNPLTGLLHKYDSRVLITLSTNCAINCRYCFRRAFPYQENRISDSDWHHILDYICAHPQVNEVIFSGGDPLMLPDRALQRAIQFVETLPQITRLRIHSRLPVVIPARLHPGIQNFFYASRLKIILVIHMNHPQEMDLPLKKALQATRANGVTLLNQSVLLRGVNDDIETLVALSETLFDADTLPYYLHHLDRVQGSAHFAVDSGRALSIHQALQKRLPGFLVPKYVIEMPGQQSKTLIV